MDYNFTIITPDNTLLDKRMVRLYERLEKKYETRLVPFDEKVTAGEKSNVFVLPFSLTPQKTNEIMRGIPENSTTFGGSITEDAKEIAMAKSIRHINILTDEEFCLENALITAEATLSLLISSTEACLYGMRIAVFGYGRIGSRLTRMLTSLGATVKVFTSDKEELSALKTRGIPYSHLWQRQDISSFSAIVNTIPLHHVIPRETLEKLKKDTLVLDLASGSNNVDWVAFKLLCLKGEHATSLPGKFSPLSSAIVIEKTIFKYLE